MSIIFKTSDNNFLIDHHSYLSDLYKNVIPNRGENQSFDFSAKIFCIKGIKKDAKRIYRKRSFNSDLILKETMLVKEIYEKFILEVPSHIKSKINTKYNIWDTADVRQLSHKLFESTLFHHASLNGGNNSDNPLRCDINGNDFLLPPRSRFLCGCVKEQCKKLDGNKYDLVIADPPWWNKYIRRLKNANDKLSYSMMYNEDIASIPLQSLLSDNCLVAVWCTNAPSNIEAVKTIIFPKWGVEYVTTWYWLKVNIDLEPLCDFGVGYRKQPFERLIFGKIGAVRDIPHCQLITSVPSALHSHKPPLLELLSPYLNVEKPKTLELFARYLLPDTTSVGYEPLKWQHISLFESLSS